MNPRELRSIGRYRVRRFIAEGGMAWVFEVEDPTFEGRRLALKMLKPEAAAGDQFRRFESEARLLAGIDHPNLVTIFDLGNDEETGCYYYTMTLVDGPALSERGVLSVEEAIPIFLEVLAGLATLHDRGIVHRDIKPANILLHSDGRAVLADLGIARVADQASDLTKTMMAIGTVKYMSPEQARGHRVGPPSDVLSVGLTFFQTITGQSIYDSVDSIDSGSGQSILFYLGSMSGRSGAELPLQFSSDLAIPDPIRKVIAKACRFKAEDRYQNAREMRESLAAAQLQGGATPGLRISPTLIAATLAAVTAVAAIAWYGNTRIARTNAEDALAVLNRAEGSAAEVIDRAASLSPPVAQDLLESARKRVSHAEIFALQGREKLEAGRSSDALVLVEDATGYFERACDDILSGDLKDRTEAAVAGAKSRVAEIDLPESKEHLQAEFAALYAKIAELDAVSEQTAACEVARLQFARLQLSGELSTDTALVESRLQQLWPELAMKAKDAAGEAERAANALSVNASAFAGPMDEGRAALAVAETAYAAQDYRAARRSFVDAREAFEFAAKIAPAAAAREEALALHRSSDPELTSQSVVNSALNEAEALFQAEDWVDAETEFRDLVALLESLTADRLSASAALTAADSAETQRGAALDAGADRAAPEEFAAAEREQSEAVAALESKRYDVAEAGFRKAHSAYEKAARVAGVRLNEAKTAAGRARKAAADLVGEADCSSLGGPARTPCSEGWESERLGIAALEERNAVDALRSLEHALNRYQDAVNAQRAFIANRQQPPFLVSRTPRDKVVREYRNTPVRFEIEADDPNADDVLQYTWNVDGKRTGDGSNAFTYRGDRDAEITVSVDDGHKGRIEQSWQLAFKNRKPELRLTPASRRIELTVGGRHDFRAEATDPDGEPVRLAFLLDGKQVSDDSRYTFVADRPGRFELSARATDGGGASVRKTVEIQVAAKPPPRVAAVEPPEPKPSAAAKTPPPRVQPTAQPPKPAADPQPPAPSVALAAKTPPAPKPTTKSQADGAGVAALREYESAYEALDIGRLSRVWIMNRNQKKAMTTMFADVRTLSLDLKIVGITVEDQSIYIDFDQTITSEGRARLSTKPAHMTATVIPQAGGKWVISSILPRS